MAMVVVSENCVSNEDLQKTRNFDEKIIKSVTLANNNNNNNNINNNNTNNNDNKMTAKAVLICRPNSHPFCERNIALDHPVKIGRSVARWRCSPTNAIFDCKVLSRNHALLWFDNGKFFLQDTHSSNGTFVNNNRLSDENEQRQVNSGDIIQFGVDVVENNCQVRHGCIIATLKLYLPDGKEAKLGSNISEDVHHAYVPVDELYKLHQIIQEMSEREECLELKLTMLETFTKQAKKSANESWQTYIGEERLLSRISKLESQLQHVGKNLTEDKYKKEIVKLQEDNAAYETAVKEVLEKLHNERLKAVELAAEQERSRMFVEKELVLVKQHLSQVQREFEDVVKKLTEEQNEFDKNRIQFKEQQLSLQKRLDAEIEKYNEAMTELQELKGSNKRIICEDDVKSKEDKLAENECETKINNANGIEKEENHIHLTVAPIVDKCKETEIKNNEETIETEIKENLDNCILTAIQSKEILLSNEFCQNGTAYNNETNIDDENEKDDFDVNMDSKTLKYKYQSVQNELKKKIEYLESQLNLNQLKTMELETNLNNEKELCKSHLDENIALNEKLKEIENEWINLSSDNKALKDHIETLTKNINRPEDVLENVTKETLTATESNVNTNSLVAYEKFVCLEEELVLLKEKYTHVNNEKLKIQNDFKTLHEKYLKLCNNSYNTIYFYMAPLILMILYLVISAMIS